MLPLYAHRLLLTQLVYQRVRSSSSDIKRAVAFFNIASPAPTGWSGLPVPGSFAAPEKRGQIYFYYSNFSDCAHAELLKANNSLNHAPLPRHREIPLRHLNWSLHARKIRVEKINLSPLWSCPLYGRMRNVRVEALRSLAPGQNL